MDASDLTIKTRDKNIFFDIQSQLITGYLNFPSYEIKQEYINGKQYVDPSNTLFPDVKITNAILSMAEKVKADRLSEGITLLKKLPDVGIPASHFYYKQVKERITTWVNDGIAFDERFDFSSHWADLNLPVKVDKVASLNLLAKHK
jgi:hypothetical protein